MSSHCNPNPFSKSRARLIIALMSSSVLQCTGKRKSTAHVLTTMQQVHPCLQSWLNFTSIFLGIPKTGLRLDPVMNATTSSGEISDSSVKIILYVTQEIVPQKIKFFQSYSDLPFECYQVQNIKLSSIIHCRENSLSKAFRAVTTNFFISNKRSKCGVVSYSTFYEF